MLFVVCIVFPMRRLKNGAHVRGGTSNSLNTRAQADTAQIDRNDNPSTLSGRRTLRGRTKHDPTNRTRAEIQTSYSVVKRHAGIFSGSRFGNVRFDVLNLVLSKLHTHAIRRNPFLPVPPCLKPHPLVSQSPLSAHFASWRLLPLPSTSIPRFETCGSPKKNSAAASTGWVTLDRALILANLTKERTRQTVMEMVRLDREPMLEMLFLAKQPTLHQEVTTCPKQIGKNNC